MEVSVIHTSDSTCPLDLTSIVEDEPVKWYHRFLNCILPSKAQVNLAFTYLLALFLLGSALFGLLHKDVFPGSEVFALLSLALLAFLGGKIVSFIRLPEIIGMMGMGFLYRNLRDVPYYKDISPNTITAIREIALTYILLRAGLSLDSGKLKKLFFIVLRLTLIPCITEAGCMAVLAHYLLQLPWVFSSMLGFIVSAISPAVVLPLLLKLERKGYGVRKGIPTLIIAATAFDDIVAIAGFTICFSIAFSTSSLTWTLINGPLEPLLGCAVGAVFGVLLWYFPSHNMKKPYLVYYNVLLLSLGSIAAMVVSRRLSVQGIGPLTCLTLAFVAAIKWRRDTAQFNGISEALTVIWELIQPFLFALIGSEITLDNLTENAAYAVLTVVLGIICRSTVTAFCCLGAGFNWKEKMFICFAWLPKATVQAAVGAQALDYARRQHKDAEFSTYGTIVLNASVLSIVLTAPLAASLIGILGSHLLAKEETLKMVENDDISEESHSVTSTRQRNLSYGSFQASIKNLDITSLHSSQSLKVSRTNSKSESLH